MNKVKIYEKNSIDSILNERLLLSVLKHPFIINMHFAFQTKDCLYIVMDYLSGGDLRYNICKYKKFTEIQAKFILCCLILALEYLHFNKIIHRDIKPENLVFDHKGYVYLTDMGIAKPYIPEKELIDSSGTPGYMAPEVINNKNHDLSADFFAIGIILHEFMFCKRPYVGKNRAEIKEQMFTKEINVKHDDIPENWSIEAADLLMKLLKRKPQDRIGFKNGIVDIKEHAWFRNVNWVELYNKEAKAPYIPKVGDNFDVNYCNKADEFDKSTYDYHLSKVNSEKHFVSFYYDEKNYLNKETTFEFEGRHFKIMNPHDEKYIEVNKQRKISGNSTLSNTASNTPNIIPKIINVNNITFTPQLTPNLNRVSDLTMNSQSEKKEQSEDVDEFGMRKLKI